MTLAEERELALRLCNEKLPHMAVTTLSLTEVELLWALMKMTHEEIARYYRALGTPTVGLFAFALWRFCSGNLDGSSAADIYTHCGYIPFQGYPLKQNSDRHGWRKCRRATGMSRTAETQKRLYRSPPTVIAGNQRRNS